MKILTVLMGVSLMAFSFFACGKAENPLNNSPKFNEYRETIKKRHGIDIINFTGRLDGGLADGKDITKYGLDQLLMGIEVEMEHTSDKMKALEISTDHLEEIPDYYTRLHKMEEDYEKETGKK